MVTSSGPMERYSATYCSARRARVICSRLATGARVDGASGLMAPTVVAALKIGTSGTSSRCRASKALIRLRTRQSATTRVERRYASSPSSCTSRAHWTTKPAQPPPQTTVHAQKSGSSVGTTIAPSRPPTIAEYCATRCLKQLAPLIPQDQLLDGRGPPGQVSQGEGATLLRCGQHDPVKRVPVQVVPPPAILEAGLGVQQTECQVWQRLDRHRERRVVALVLAVAVDAQLKQQALEPSASRARKVSGRTRGRKYSSTLLFPLKAAACTKVNLGSDCRSHSSFCSRLHPKRFSTCSACTSPSKQACAPGLDQYHCGASCSLLATPGRTRRRLPSSGRTSNASGERQKPSSSTWRVPSLAVGAGGYTKSHDIPDAIERLIAATFPLRNALRSATRSAGSLPPTYLALKRRKRRSWTSQTDAASRSASCFSNRPDMVSSKRARSSQLLSPANVAAQEVPTSGCSKDAAPACVGKTGASMITGLGRCNDAPITLPEC
eukprot:scaffold169977_cov27-Tisochrysis_lutea.AAC.1